MALDVDLNGRTIAVFVAAVLVAVAFWAAVSVAGALVLAVAFVLLVVVLYAGVGRIWDRVRYGSGGGGR